MSLKGGNSETETLYVPPFVGDPDFSNCRHCEELMGNISCCIFAPARRRTPEDIARCLSLESLTDTTTSVAMDSNEIITFAEPKIFEVPRFKNSRVLILGRVRAGKSSFRNTMFHGYGVDHVKRICSNADQKVQSHYCHQGRLVDVQDYGGLQNLAVNSYRNVAGMIYVFDAGVKNYDEDLEKYARAFNNLLLKSPDAKVFVVLHKTDLLKPGEVETVFWALKSKILKIHEGICGNIIEINLRMTYFQTTCLDSIGIQLAWNTILQKCFPCPRDVKDAVLERGRALRADQVLLFDTRYLVLMRMDKLTDYAPFQNEREVYETLSTSYHDTYQNRKRYLKVTDQTCRNFLVVSLFVCPTIEDKKIKKKKE
ncbi:hypothetical protein CRE_17135 [Caenorhabditis remanei]|uniref:Uncharacterized protein n=1 Tax=Caenorhabditis remanei TaxID=31234 RepID=E3MAB0_CAERE|nr:hypothetical protein CRE_17135 [Caenorhabditis remanei]